MTSIRRASCQEITDAVFAVFDPEVVETLSPNPFRHFVGMVRRRLEKPGPPPTFDELVGLKELAFDHLWHSAFDVYAPRRPEPEPKRRVAKNEVPEIHIRRDGTIMEGAARWCLQCVHEKLAEEIGRAMREQ